MIFSKIILEVLLRRKNPKDLLDQEGERQMTLRVKEEAQVQLILMDHQLTIDERALPI